jgi:sulfite reductase beta subunit-like hemoprotein
LKPKLDHSNLYIKREIALTTPLPLPQLTETDVQYDQTVRADIEEFRLQANRFLSGELNDDQFRPHRLRRGIYGQRQPGVQMVRTKVPGGTVTSAQMLALAEIAEDFGGGKAHLTTRQNVQYHFVPLARVPDLLHRLADFRLTTREACYNTVRNVTACPLSGLLPGEPFDVQPYARKLAFAFLHKELTDSMPRKFKIALSACPDDCMLTSIHDVGLRAILRDGRPGFRMVVGGGLGPLPSEARLLDEFIPADLIVGRIEAVLRVFNQCGNRKNKNKARFKFIIRERGFDWVREEIDKAYRAIQAEGGIATPETIPEGFGGFQAAPPPRGTGEGLPIAGATHAPDPDFDRWLETNVQEQRQSGYAIVTVRTPQGNLTASQMRGLADLASRAGDGLLRFAVNQDLHLAYLPVHSLKRVYAALRLIGLAESGAGEIADVTSCPGAYSCNLALTKSMNLGAALSASVAAHTDPGVRALTINISGCPNSCGQHWTGDLGFYGNARKIDGREVPYYQMLLGGGADSEGIMRFGLAIQSLPARLIPTAVDRILKHFLAHRSAGESFRDYVVRHKVETFRALVADLSKPPAGEDEMFRDWGDEMDYSLQLGRGECAA